MYHNLWSRRPFFTGFLPSPLPLPTNPQMAAVVESSSSSSDAPSTPKAFTPNDFVHSIVGKSVVVKLNSGVAYHGVLACLDGFMNLALEQCEEYVDGQRTKSFGDCFIRGNNGKCSFLAFAAPSVCARVRVSVFFWNKIFPVF